MNSEPLTSISKQNALEIESDNSDSPRLSNNLPQTIQKLIGLHANSQINYNNIFKRIFFGWANPFLKIGSNTQFKQEWLPALPPTERLRNNIPIIQKEFSNQTPKKKQKKRTIINILSWKFRPTVLKCLLSKIIVQACIIMLT